MTRMVPGPSLETVEAAAGHATCERCRAVLKEIIVVAVLCACLAVACACSTLAACATRNINRCQLD